MNISNKEDNCCILRTGPCSKSRKENNSSYICAVKLLLYPFALIYAAIVSLRNACYEFGIFSVTEYDFPVIGVGNLRVGGTGKTPMVEYLIRLLKQDRKPAMLSRGYGRKTDGLRLVAAGDNSLLVGDEPAQIKSKFPDIVVAVDGNRVRGINKLREAEPGINTLLLDDVFQHRAVKPGLMILLTTYQQPYMDDAVLPAGRLREPVQSAKRADIIVVTKCPANISAVEKHMLRDRIRPRAYQNVFFAYERYGAVRKWNEAAGGVGISLQGKYVLLVTGIAQPENVKDYLDSMAHVSDHLEYADHHWYTTRDIDLIASRFETIPGEDKVIVTTEKDAQRLLTYLQNEKFARLPVYVLPVEVAFTGSDTPTFNNAIHEFIRSYRASGTVHP